MQSLSFTPGDNCMQTISEIDPSAATGKTKEVMGRVVERIGRVPKMIRLMANSPPVVEGYMQFTVALTNATLSQELRALIAFTIAEENGCKYSHTIAQGQAEGLNLTAEDRDAACRAEADDPRIERALIFARRIVRERGKVSPAEVSELRFAGFNDAEIVEIIATVALNVFRNYFNLVVGTEVDLRPALPDTSALAGGIR